MQQVEKGFDHRDSHPSSLPSPPLSHHALLNTPPLAPGNVFHKINFSHLVPRIYEMRQTAYAANETTCKRMLMSVSILIKLRLV